MSFTWSFYPVAIASLLVLPVATFIAARWTRQPWVFALGLIVVALRLVMSFFTARIIDVATSGGWVGGSVTIGELVSVLQIVGNLANALLMSAIILVVAHAARPVRAASRSSGGD